MNFFIIKIMYNFITDPEFFRAIVFFLFCARLVELDELD